MWHEVFTVLFSMLWNCVLSNTLYRKGKIQCISVTGNKSTGGYSYKCGTGQGEKPGDV